jgi:hypothetical protein
MTVTVELTVTSTSFTAQKQAFDSSLHVVIVELHADLFLVCL